jgi:molecular chaperone GrpE
MSEKRRPKDADEQRYGSAQKPAVAEGVNEIQEPASAREGADDSEGAEVSEQAQDRSETVDTRIADLEAEIASLKDQLLRTLAEAENVRRRGQREREESAKYATAPLVKDLLGVADNLRRAIESVPPDSIERDEHLKALLTGVELTEQGLLEVFERHHVTKIAPLGEKLDPHRHEAMFEVADPDKPAGTVVQVFQPGYLLRDRLMRPARVGVAKGGPTATDGGSEQRDGKPEVAEAKLGSSVDKMA